MKKLLLFVVFITTFTLVFSLPRPAAAETVKFVGVWRYTGQGESHQNTLTFRPDGRFSNTTRLANGGVIQISGRWRYEDGKLHYTYEKSSVPIPEVAPGKTGVDIVESVTDRMLVVLQGVRKERAVFHRRTD
jgi:hypothetical protein